MPCRSCAKRRAEREKLLKQRREAEARKKKADSASVQEKASIE